MAPLDVFVLSNGVLMLSNGVSGLSHGVSVISHCVSVVPHAVSTSFTCLTSLLAAHRLPHLCVSVFGGLWFMWLTSGLVPHRYCSMSAPITGKDGLVILSFGVVVVELPQTSEDDLRCARALRGRRMR